MNSTKPSKNYFLPYLKYKMRENRVSAIIFFILNFLALIVPHIIMYVTISSAEERENAYNSVIIIDDPPSIIINLFLFFSAIVTIMFLIVSARSFKYYHNRAMMDTLGCLPLSYKDRFWGDYFGGLISNMISFVPFAVISIILTLKMAKDIEVYDFMSYFPYNFRKMIISTFIMYAAVHAITAFITSCCGRLGTSIFFSVVTMVIIPGIYVAYGMVGFQNLLGIEPLEILADHVGMFTPFGEIFSQVLKDSYGSFNIYSGWIKSTFAIDSVFNVIVMILTIAAFIAGAYFIGKRRKAERVEQGFVFNMPLYVISIVISAMVIGFALYYFPKGYKIDAISVLKAAGLSFALFMGLELSQKKNFKGIWKSLIRYVLVFGVSFGSLILMRATKGFGEESRIPIASSVSEIKIEGEYFYWSSDGREIIYKDSSSISAIIEGHKNLLEHSSELSTGDMLEITYRMKSGNETIRRYSCSKENEIIRGFSNDIKNLDEEAIPMIFLDDPVYDDALRITVHKRIKGDYGYNEENHFIRPDKFEEFVGILKNDIKYNYEENYTLSSVSAYYYGRIILHNEETSLWYEYRIYTPYEDTVAFLENSENLLSSETEYFKGNEKYSIFYQYYPDNSPYGYTVDVNIKASDESAAVQKLIGFIVPKDAEEAAAGAYSKYFTIYDQTSYVNYAIKAEDEKAARDAIIEVFRRKVLR